MKKVALIIICISLFACKQKQENHLNIAVAANMQYAIQRIVAEYTSQTGVKCNLIISSSGKLTAQIKEGAPYHVFVSANMKYPNELYQNNLTTSPPKVYAYGKLVLWTMIDSLTPSINLLKNKSISHIAVANPKTAPYGHASIETLKNYNLYQQLKHKLVFGESISQTNQFITSKSATIGFTSLSVVLSSAMKDKGNWVEIDESFYSPIKQGVVIIKQQNNQHTQASQFYNFLFSKTAKNILLKNGYFTDK